MMEVISPSYLLAIGILLIGLEAVIFSFVIFFLGLALIIVSVISSFYTFDNAIIQLALASIIALFSAFFLRNYILEKISKPSEKPPAPQNKSMYFKVFIVVPFKF